VTGGLEGGRNVFHSERFNPEEWTKTEALVPRYRPQQQDVHSQGQQRNIEKTHLVVPVIPRLLSWCQHRRRFVIAGALCLLVLSGLGIRRLSFDTDVLSLLPRDGRVIPAFRTFVERFGSLDDLYVVLTAPEGRSVADYDEEVSAWIDGVRGAPGIARVDTGLVDRSRDLSWLADRQLLLLGEGSLDKAVRRLRGDDMREALASRRELLALPSADIADLVRQDPLGIYDLLREELGAAQAGVNLGVTQGGYVTPDGRSRLLIARPASPPFDTEFARGLMAGLEQVRAEVMKSRETGSIDATLPPLTVELAGGHRIAVETEALVKRESISNTVGSLALILPLLFVVFRSLWLVLVGPIPSAVSLIVVLGILGVAGATLSAAATASAAMLFGLGVDGVVLMYVSYTLALRDTGSGEEAVRQLGGPAYSMLLGMWTTAATFYGLMFVDFPSLQQLGALIGHSMVFCGIFTFLLVPALLPRRAVPARRRPLTMPGLAAWVQRHRRAIRVAAVIATISLGWAATGVRVNPTLDRLRSVTPGAALLEDIAPRFGLPHDVYLIVQRGTDLEALLAVDERIAKEVRRTVGGVHLQAASTILPSNGTQIAREAAISAAGLSTVDVASRLAVAATAEGFAAGTFAPFVTRLPRLMATGERLTFDGYVEHGLADLVGRFVAREKEGWVLVSYAIPSGQPDLAALERVVTAAGGSATLTGLPLVNRELAARFSPQFLKGLGIGTFIVLLLIVVALRNWRLSILALAPAALGLVWAGGLLALARIELDLFALFGVVTFVGIGVDYGIHLVHRYRERGGAAHALEELAPVILVAAAITLFGYGTLVTSSYPPLRSIGVVSVVAVITLAAAALLVLPALLPDLPVASKPEAGSRSASRES
jgi:predicted RND superfamily exporter protein